MTTRTAAGQGALFDLAGPRRPGKTPPILDDQGRGVRSLTVVPPWPLAIVRGWKPVENRTTNLAGSWRGRVLILSGATKWDEFGAAFIAEQTGIQVGRPECHPGHYIGAADLVDVHLNAACCRPWGQDGMYHLVFENPVEFEQPIKADGHLGLRWVTDPIYFQAAWRGVAA